MKLFISLCICIVCVACDSKSGSSNTKYADVFARHEPRISSLRNSLKEIKHSISNAAISTTSLTGLAPVINLGNYDTVGNTLILQYHLLEHPENFTSTDSSFGLYYNTLAADAFKWTGVTKERMVMEQDYLKDDEIDKKIAPLSTDRFPYLLIVKMTANEPLVNNADGSFTGGNATAAYYVYDWKNRKQLAAVSLTAKPDETMLYAYQDKDGTAGKYEAAKAKAQGTMQNNMRLQLYNWLKTITGGAAIVPGL